MNDIQPASSQFPFYWAETNCVKFLFMTNVSEAPQRRPSVLVLQLHNYNEGRRYIFLCNYLEVNRISHILDTFHEAKNSYPYVIILRGQSLTSYIRKQLP